MDPMNETDRINLIPNQLNRDDLNSEERLNLVQACKASGLIETAISWLERQLVRQPDDGQLSWLLLDVAWHGRDLPRVAELCAQMLRRHRQRTPDTREGTDHLRRLRFRALCGLVQADADAALADFPGGASLMMAAELAQNRYRFSTSRSLARMVAAPIIAEQAGKAFPAECRSALELEERLALMEADIAAAMDARQQIWDLQRRSDDPEMQRLVGAEPLRQWRLELGANRPALQLLENLRNCAPAMQLGPIAVGLEREPRATALAFGLLLQLRRAGWLGPESPLAPAANHGTVPSTFWLQRHFPLDSPAHTDLAERWRALHPGCSLEWVDPGREGIEARSDLPPLVREACLCVNDPLIRGDLLRLALIWLYGGVAVEANARCQRNLLELLTPELDLLLVQDPMGSLTLPLLAACPHHPWVGSALEAACRTALNGEGYSRWDVSGACPLSLAFAHFSLEAIKAGAMPAGVRIVSVHELRRWIGLDLPLPPPEGSPEVRPIRQLFHQQRRRAALRRLQTCPQ
jgi:hypothetical protein